jgi:hypothetical protein
LEFGSINNPWISNPSRRKVGIAYQVVYPALIDESGSGTVADLQKEHNFLCQDYVARKYIICSGSITLTLALPKTQFYSSTKLNE